MPQSFLTFEGEYDEYKQPVYKDKVGNKWRDVGWKYNMFHSPCKNIKLVHYDLDDLDTDVVGIIDIKNHSGSSEIIVNKKDIVIIENCKIINVESMVNGSYNFKDFRIAGQYQHFVADVLPSVIYCSCF